MNCNGQMVFDRVQPSEIRVTYTFKCCRCATALTQDYFGSYLIPPNFPNGWTQIADNRAYGPGWVCPNHKVDIVVDGNTVFQK